MSFVEKINETLDYKFRSVYSPGFEIRQRVGKCSVRRLNFKLEHLKNFVDSIETRVVWTTEEDEEQITVLFTEAGTLRVVVYFRNLHERDDEISGFAQYFTFIEFKENDAARFLRLLKLSLFVVENKNKDFLHKAAIAVKYVYIYFPNLTAFYDTDMQLVKKQWLEGESEHIKLYLLQHLLLFEASVKEMHQALRTRIPRSIILEEDIKPLVELAKLVSWKPNCDWFHTKNESPVFEKYEKRLESFTLWPLSFIKPKDLANAGFFYKGIGDEVVCFRCLNGLCNWERGDNPKTEHLKHYPSCSFIRSISKSVSR